MKLKNLILPMCLLILISGCNQAQKSQTSQSNQQTTTKQNTTPQQTTNNQSTTQQKVFTKDELAKYNGQNGKPAYVAVNGVVYDVTNSDMWKNGKHKNQHNAGMDLTNQMKNAPHGADVFKAMPVVGSYK
jgi:predicted heme/steroid binding protein